MVELRKRPPPKEPAAPPPAAKKRGAKPKASTATASSDSAGGIAAKAKKAVGKAKAAITGEDGTKSDAPAAPGQVSATADKQPSVEDEPTAAPLEGVAPGSSAAVEKGSAGLIPETAGTAPSTTTVPAQPAASDAHQPSTSGAGVATTSLGTTGAGAAPIPPANGNDDPNRAETSEALENPPEIGKIEPATTAAHAAVAGSGLGPSGMGGGASQHATVPLGAESVGKQIALEGFGGEVETHKGEKVSVQRLIGEAIAASTKAGGPPGSGGIVIFTYPKASTPGCTKQVCFFRDSYKPLVDAGLSIFGLSTDSTKSNTTFATKQNLQYPLLCDPNASLTSAIGMKKPGPGKSTVRGVVVIDGVGIVKAWFQGGPEKTLDVVLEYVKTIGK